MPITRVSASSVTMFRQKPSTLMKKKVGISETGMAIAVISVARQSRRKRNTTSAASNMPSSNVCHVAMKPARVWSTRDRILVIDDAFDGSASSFSITAATPFSTVISLASLTLLTWKPTTGRPLSSAKERTSAEPSPTSATSESRTERPPPVGIVRLRICSTVTAAPRIRSVCSRPPTVTRPPGASRLATAKAWLTLSAVRPCAARRSGSTMTLISRSTPPTRLTCATPGAACSARAMVSSMNHDSSCVDMAGAETA